MEERSLGEGKDMIHMYFNFKIVLNILKLCFYKEEFSYELPCSQI